MRFYICGKIGEEKPSTETLAKFKEAEDMLKGRGHEVFNPTNEDWQIIRMKSKPFVVTIEARRLSV